MSYYDYHIHSFNSPDGKNSVIEICEVALNMGLREIAIADHFEPLQKDPTDSNYVAQFQYYDVLKARAVYGSSMTILLALEMGNPHKYQQYSQMLLEKYPYDYVLGSVHKLSGEKDTDMEFLHYNPDNYHYYIKKYLSDIKELALWNKFDCLAHFDLPKRYIGKAGITVSLLPKYEAEVTEILKILVQNNKGLELNTSGLSNPYINDFLPSLDILELFRSLGGEIVCVGSDSHCIEHINKDDIKKGNDALKKAGFTQLSLFSRRKHSFVPIGEKISFCDEKIS